MRNTSSKANPILRCISGVADLVIPACDGSQVLVKAKEVFRVFIDPDFKKFGLSKPSKPTGITPVDVYEMEMEKDADFKKIFTFLSLDWEELCLTEHQVKIFCKEHTDWLITNGFGTFFLTKKDWGMPATLDNLFVVLVDVYSDDGLRAYAFRFDEDDICDADDRYHLVVPQLEI